MIIIFVIIAVVGYFLPYIIAERKNHHRKATIGLLNLFFGWTLIAWLLLLVWALDENIF